MKNSLARFALCWFLFPFLFLSVCSGKLIPYILPCFPPLAILFAIGLAAYFQADKSRAFSLSAWVLAVTVGLAGAFLLFSSILPFEETRLYGPDESMKWIVASLGFLLFALLVLWSTRIKDYRKKLVFYCTAVLTVFFTVSFALPDKAMDSRTPGRLLERNLSKVTTDAVLVSNDNLICAVCWFFKRDNVKLIGEVGELRYGLDNDDTKPGKLLSVDGLKQIIHENEGKRPVILILIKEHYKIYKDQLPPPFFKDADTHFVFAVFF